MIEKIFETRWIIGGVLILLFTIFEIHGSSISIYADILGHPELSDIIFGQYRWIRSDEWIVFTPFAFSQYFTNFSLISDIVRAAPTNMFMTYGQAVWHPAVIFRPAQLGFLFLDQGSGLAFFWMSRLVILFLVSFEFARLILQVDRKFSVLYAIMIAFSPLAQWWWAVNSIAEILAAGQGLVVCWKLYLDCVENRKRFAAGFLYCAGVFIFGIYPAWQVSFGYVFLACLIAVSFAPKIRRREGQDKAYEIQEPAQRQNPNTQSNVEKNSFAQESNALKIFWRDKFFWLIGFVVMLAPIVHAVCISLDMIEIQMATEYPGKRFELGGGWDFFKTLKMLMIYGLDVVLPFKPMIDLPTNECEASSFFTMAPLGWLMFFYLRFKLKQRDFLMTALFVVSTLFFVWEFVNLPAWLAKISFLSNVTNNRARSAIDFAQLAMAFRGVVLIKNFLPSFHRLILAEAIALLTALCSYIFVPAWFGVKSFLAVFAFTSLSVFLFLSPMNKKICATLAILMLGIGATINPINSGVDVICKMPVGQKISEIVQQDKKSLWIVEDTGVALNDIPIMFGAPTINSVNVYPVLERWKKLDPDGKNFVLYNRYAHIILTLQNTPTEFSVPRGDFMILKLNVEDLPKLDARYILSRNGELENLSTPQIKITRIYEDAGSFIYEVKTL